MDAIANLLAGKRSSAALSHYPTLRIQTNNLNLELRRAIERLDRVLDKWSFALTQDQDVASEFRATGTVTFPYRTIAPYLVRNLHQTADFLLHETRAAPAVDADRVSETIPSFADFIRLGASVRGFADALVQAAYQLITFDGLQLNYKFFQSLLSFAAVAPASLQANIVSAEVQTALNAYVALSNRDKKNSTFTKATHDQFPQRLLVACQAVGFPDDRRRNLELLFSFCSDFVHSGYVSVLALGDSESHIIMGGPGDAFTARNENFAELKQRLLAECVGAYKDLFIPIIQNAIGRTLAAGVPPDWATGLDAAVRGIDSVYSILNRELVEPVRKGLTLTNEKARIRCMCGTYVDLGPPHHNWDRYCKNCGSRFVLTEVDEEFDYVISSTGVGDVLGGDAIKIANLDDASKTKMNRLFSKHSPKVESASIGFRLISDLDECDEDTLSVGSRITSTPTTADPSACKVFTFVAAKSLARCEIVRIRCNCGATVDYRTASKTNACQCSKCQRVIGLIGVTGDGSSVVVQNPDGSPGFAPIQARSRFKIPGIATD